ncbi:MAG TPA: hypothetical protein PLI09_21715 [Candidatus Hydrogenedentes bacterium]|nr:hypothetical protein [Candidatus Hydrogenedentota bacterium]
MKETNPGIFCLYFPVPRRIVSLVVISALCVAGLSCSPGDTRREIKDIRTSAVEMAEKPVKMTTQERLGLSKAKSTSAMPMGHESLMGGAVPEAIQLKWTGPEGWEKAEDRSMRLVTYMSQNGTVECYASLLSGPAGGVEPNINRWRQQMAQPALTTEEINALRKIRVMGKDSPLIEILGEYSGMTEQATPGQKMLGVVCPLDDQTLFIKMVGPDAGVTAEMEHFIAFCESFEKAVS